MPSASRARRSISRGSSTSALTSAGSASAAQIFVSSIARRRSMSYETLTSIILSSDEGLRPSAGAPCVLRNLRTAGSDVYGNRLIGLVIDRRVSRVVILPVERHALLGPQQLDQLDGFPQSGETLLVVGPCNPESALIEMRSGANTQDHPSWIQRPQRPKRLRDDGRVIAKCGRCDRGAEPDSLGAFAHGGEPGKRKRRVAVRVAPGLEVVADENAVEAAPLGVDREIEKHAWCELFGRSLVPEPQHVYVELSACSNASS